MGQTTSKQKTSHDPGSPSSAGPSTRFPTASTPSLDDGAVASQERPRRSRRSTIRRSIIGLVGKTKGPSEPVHSSTARSDAPPSSRKSWRRISRALSLGATEEGRATVTSVTSNKKKGKERAVEVVEGEDDEQPKPSTSSQRPVSPIPMRRQSSPSILSNALETEDIPSEPSTDCDIDGSHPPVEPTEPPPTTTPAPAHTDPLPEAAMPPHPQLDQSQPGPRHFPPPGTLVVVQGVVNTIDTGSNPNNNGINSAQSNNAVFPTTSSRPNSGLFSSSARSRPSTPTGEHNGNRNNRRLSSIIRRPANMFNDSRRNTIIEGDGVTDAPSLGLAVDSVSRPLSDTPSDSTTPTTPPDPDPENQATQQRPLSPGSIDVLGTLLSVAAAATAASLFSPNSFAGRTEPSPDTNISRPTSPTPTAGLGVNGFRPLDTLAELGFPMDRDQGIGAGNNPGANGHNLSRERLRGAWDSLRERLGLRDTRNNPENAAPEPFGDGRDGNRTGTGEAMITEMARVLGTGLGLQEEGPNRPTDAPTVATPNVMANVSPVPPPEGTFERFLYNLQADLRMVLSEDLSAEQSTSNPSGPAESNDGGASANTEEPNGDSDLPQVVISDHGDEQQTTEPSHNTEVADRTTTPDPTTLSPTTPGPPPSERRSTGGINLWRSYRFPPIIAPSRPSPPVSGVDQTTTAPSSHLPNPPLNVLDEPIRSGYPPRPDTPVPSSTVPLQPPPSAQADVVVPVIIVGLQSVNIDPQRTEHPEGSDGIFGRQDHRGEDPVQPPEPWGHGEDGEQTMRGRPWHTRAADALRNLRPGRRNGSSITNANDRAASRTFLIYVIGGYYPPNHHIVTGTDGMDSYDALWELAALIGQVKPPTATPEDIEKSGLQIIKPTDIPQYASEGKVAPNCIDRCMICLDDYEPEQDLRLMSCKHFFHQNCVDKWLQVGRNNCPACRMKGVTTTADQDSSQNPISPTIPTP